MSAPRIRDLSTDPARLVLEALFTGTSAGVLYEHFSRPDLLTKWWPQEATLEDARPGAVLHLAWPAMDWHLRGTVLEAEPGQVFAFTWKWDHEQALPERTVQVRFSSSDNGAAVHLEHGNYGAAESELADRQSHLEGWQHFLGQLGEVLKGSL